MNMTARRRRILWEMVNDQLDGAELQDAEFIAEQWVCEIMIVLGATC